MSGYSLRVDPARSGYTVFDKVVPIVAEYAT